MAELSTADINNLPRTLPRPCLVCGTLIPFRYGKRARQTAKFCGNECKFAYQREHPARLVPRLVVACYECGRAVQYLASQRRRTSEAIYCNRICKGRAHSRLLTGRQPSGGVYSASSTFREMARRQLADQCVVCGWDLASCDVCHLIPRKGGGSDRIENVVMLCPNHHRLLDRGLLALV